MDFVQGLDSSKLVLGGVALSFLISLFSSPPYNLPIFLFGTYVQEQSEATQSLQTFAGLLGISAIFDVIWMMRNDQSGFIKFLTVILTLLKIPTFFAFLLVMRQRGTQFGGLRAGEGATVWSMPGGFTSSGREGYQNVDDESFNHQPRPTPKTTAPNNPSTLSPPGAYETV
ncbi:hypothetical protein P691DRAFT_812423 [Macrolepiota fuliginosa MF-IS2]|uniref:Uncharacterized protein n=1 Tax=Macrolepiota fuliginosa MF-IS2 TaxID=1400762 RepID=A0A9P5XR51_9AGAR|nr:hypothetical protein P691DRAFT_812423 [Macrolepiota fuliginosa MF-IS2]